MLCVVVIVYFLLNEVGQLKVSCEGIVLEIVEGLPELGTGVGLLSLIVFVIKRFQIDLELIVHINGRFGASLEGIRLLADQGEIL